jgi:capsular polysaccharide biosynthesis protein
MSSVVSYIAERAADLPISFLPARRRKFIATRLLPELIERYASVTSYREVATRESTPNWPVADSSSFRIDLPEYCNRIPDEVSEIVGNHECAAPYVMELSESVVIGSHGFIVDSEGKYVVYNYCTAEDGTVVEFSDKFLRAIEYGTLLPLRPDVDAETRIDRPAVSLLVPYAANYTHWTQECLTLLEGVEKYESETGKQPLLLIPRNPPSFVTDSLEVLGYDSDRLVELGEDAIQFRKLVVPSVRRCSGPHLDGFVRDVRALRWVADRALANVGTSDTHSSRILISREDTVTRRMVNRSAVSSALADYGFETYVLSELDYREQVRLFSQAEFVVGAHGAGMINTIYSEDSNVIELYGDHLTAANFEICQGLGSDYGCLSCPSEGDDIEVDIGELVEMIERMDGGGG